MAQDAAQRWNRTEGVLITPGTTPEEVAAFLNLHRVVARLEWYPSSTHLISITLMCDVEGRVAVTPPSRGGAVAGMGVGELAESLAREFGADATIGPASFDAMPEGLTALGASVDARLAPGLRGGDIYTDDWAPVEWLVDLSLAAEAK